jgi:hypothetical protein
MTRYEREQLIQVLRRVEVLNSKLATLPGTFTSTANRIVANFEIDGEGPMASDITNLSYDISNTISTIQNYVIPNLVYRINSSIEEDG